MTGGLLGSLKAVALGVLLLTGGGAGARDVDDLYSGQAAVTDRSPAELSRGAAAALREVLVKLTGSAAAAANAAKSLGKRASDLMLQYAYQPQTEGAGLLLTAEFDEVALSAELDNAGVPLWGKERPDTLVWLALDAGAGRQLISGDEPGLLGASLLARARQRGIPVLLPLMDIEESQHLSNAGNWEGLATTALALSSRYRTPATLVGHLSQSGPGIWEARWRLTLAGDERDWREEGDIVELLMESAVDALADRLAATYARPASLAQSELLDIAIVGVRTAEDYARVTNYLSGLDTVRDLSVRGVSNQALSVRFSARGGRAALAQSIAFGRVLLPVEGRADAFQLTP